MGVIYQPFTGELFWGGFGKAFKKIKGAISVKFDLDKFNDPAIKDEYEIETHNTYWE